MRAGREVLEEAVVLVGVWEEEGSWRACLTRMDWSLCRKGKRKGGEEERGREKEGWKGERGVGNSIEEEKEVEMQKNRSAAARECMLRAKRDPLRGKREQETTHLLGQTPVRIPLEDQRLQLLDPQLRLRLLELYEYRNDLVFRRREICGTVGRWSRSGGSVG